MAELAPDTARSTAATAADSAGNSRRDLLGALAGKQAVRESAVAEKARRVVRTSFGVMQEQEASRRRSRALAMAALLMTLLAVGPFAYRVAEDLLGGEHMSDIATQTSLWICILCPAVLAALIVGGLARNRR